jgi:Zn-dependent peptidase ImmA (M78 family)
MHRSPFPKGLECNEEVVTFRNGDELEAEADTFAAYLLMPLMTSAVDSRRCRPHPR